MEMSSKNIQRLRILLVGINFVAITYNAALFLFCTKYIVSNRLSSVLLENLTVIPDNPSSLYLMVSGLFFVLIGLLASRDYLNKEMNIRLEVIMGLEILLCLSIIYVLRDCYNGILFIAFMDIIYYFKDLNRRGPFLVLAFLFYLVTDYSLASRLFDIPSLDAYINLLSQNIRLVVSFNRNLLSAINVLVFIIFLVVYLVESIRTTQHIEEELEMVSEVNNELNSYINLSEKIAEDRERKRIAREIHDTLGHALTGISAGIDACLVLIDTKPDMTKKQLQIISKVVRTAITDVRGSLEKLRPGALEHRNFKDALDASIKEYKELSNLDITLYYEWEEVDLEKLKEDTIFRIIQETITNSLRHGHAKKVEINMFNMEDKYYIVLQDNGIGFKDIHYGYGLTQMQERAAMIGGRISFNGENGFRTFIEIPKRIGEDVHD